MGRGEAACGARGRDGRCGVGVAHRNIEIKLELRDAKLAADIARRLGGADWGVIEQTDTYYKVLTGRLKRRETRGEAVEYIAYERADRALARASTFTRMDEPTYFARYGELRRDVLCVVRKQRHLFLVRGVRVHLDEVEGLGSFLEFEAPVTGDEHGAYEVVAELREAFGPALGEPVSLGYAELARVAGVGEDGIAAGPDDGDDEGEVSDG